METKQFVPNMLKGLKYANTEISRLIRNKKAIFNAYKRIDQL